MLLDVARPPSPCRFDVSGVDPRPHQDHDRVCAILENRKHEFPRSCRVARATHSSRPGSVIGDLPARSPLADCARRARESLAIQPPTRTTGKVCRRRWRPAWAGNTRSFARASRYVGIIGEYLCCRAQGSITEFGCYCSDMAVSATGGPHLQFELLPYSLILFAILAH